MTPHGSAQISATYDALGREVELASGSTYTEFAYSPLGDKLGAMNGQTLTSGRAPLPAGGMAVYTTSSQVDRYWHGDWLGSVRLVTNASRALDFDTALAPYGERYASTGGTVAYVFTGQPQDTSYPLYDFPFREYDQTQGRWISPDPAGRAAVGLSNPQSLNRYAYVGNNALSLVDPSGLCPEGQPRCGPQYFPGPDGFGVPGGGAGCALNGIDTPCAVVSGALGAGAACIGSCTTTVTGSNGLPYSIVQTAGPAVFEGLNGEELSEGSIAELGLPSLSGFGDNPFFDFGSAGSGGGSGGAGSGTAGCAAKILGAVNQTFGTSFAPANVQLQFGNGQATNLNILASGLPVAQFNSIQTGRYPLSPLTWLTGYGPTLHITGQTFFDPAPAVFTNSNVGGATSVLFTAHIDSAFAYNPIGALIHLLTDLLHAGGPRNPCP